MAFLAALAHWTGSTLKSWLGIGLNRGSAGFEGLARSALNYANLSAIEVPTADLVQELSPPEHSGGA